MAKVYRYFFLFIFSSVFISSLVSFLWIKNQIYRKKTVYPSVSIEIKRGTSLKEISNLLEEKGIIDNRFIFYVYARFKKKVLKAGHYRFSGNISIYDVWDILYRGKEHLKPFTVYPGDTLFDIGKRLKNEFGIDESIFLSYVFNEKNVKKFSLEGKTFEGYFPPETYYFRENESLNNIVSQFIKLFKEKYLPFKKRTKEFPFYECMIIASMVEKESSLEKEKPIIAGVIINRLKRGMLLQIDPTTIYALKLAGRWNGKLTKENIHFNSPYNTYVIKGLPPTPICSFSISSLKAVINYKKTDFLYYLTKDGKKHIFSKTYREHINALKGIRK